MLQQNILPALRKNQQRELEAEGGGEAEGGEVAQGQDVGVVSCKFRGYLLYV